jgi:hypothetical protein
MIDRERVGVPYSDDGGMLIPLKIIDMEEELDGSCCVH